MESFQLFIAFLFGVGGAALAGYLLWCMLSAFTVSMRRAKEGMTLRSANQQLEVVDKLLERGEYRNALRELRRALIPNLFVRENSVVALRNHHNNILSRFLIIAEQAPDNPAVLSQLEQLLNERIELLFLHIRADGAYQKLLERRERSGKEIPKWSKSDFEKKSADIRHELERNRVDLRNVLDKLSSMLNGTKGDDEIVYH